MHPWIEERVTALQLALGIHTFPSHEDLARLVEWLGTIELRQADVDAGRCAHYGPERQVITLPRRLAGQTLTLELAHEVGHALLTVGMGALLRQQAPECFAVERLARAWDRQDERRAHDFVLAWLLPARFLRMYQNEELCELAGVTPELVQARRERYGRGGRRGEGLPRWSAANLYHVIVHVERALLYVARRGSSLPVFDLPSDRQYLERDAAQLNLDLLALTTAEFEAKHRRHAYHAPEARPLDCGELARRLAGGAA